jgi:hypothetical protein
MPQPKPLEIKASMFRGYLAAVDKAGLRDQVRALVSKQTQALMDLPPPISEWLGYEPTDELVIAIDALGGAAEVRALSRRAVLEGMAPFMRSVVQGFLSLFGVSPASLFSRMPQLTGTVSRGIEYGYTEESAHSGTLVVRYPSRHDVPLCVFVAVAGTLESIYDVCDAHGTVSAPEVIAEPAANAARFHLRWR